MSKLADGTTDPRGTPAWKRLRIQCYERDRIRGAVCVHCGQPIDYSVKPSSTDDSYEADHRIPVDTHPEYALLPFPLLGWSDWPPSAGWSPDGS